MEDTSGFYKLDGQLLHAPNFVLNANYELRKQTYTEHTYPTDGWYWFDTLEEAQTYFKIEPTPAPEEPNINSIPRPRIRVPSNDNR